MIGGKLNRNSADKGGGLQVDNGAHVALTGTQVKSNLAENGAGVYVLEGSATLMQATIDSNAASASGGGGITVIHGGVTLTDTEIINNSAPLFGGGVALHNYDATLRGSQVKLIGNSAGDRGGGIYLRFGDVTLTNSQINSNTAARGGGLYLATSGNLNVHDGCIVSNSDTAVVRTGGTLDASDNWWGASDGPSGAASGFGDSVGAGVIFSNFKTAAPAGCSSLVVYKVYLSVIVNGQTP